MMIDHQRAYDLIVPFEGSVPFIYADTKGLPTVGVGNLLATVDDAVRLPFIISGRPASSPVAASGDYIARDWRSVRNAGAGHAAHWYRQLTRCELPAQAIRDLFDRRVDSFFDQLTHTFPAFPSWREPAQLATLDWVFNVGVGKPGGAGLLGTVHLKAALYAQDWHAAAAACHRVESSQRRNDQCRDLYLRAAG